MKLFHISDVLSATTGRVVSREGMGGIYTIYNFLTGVSLYTHQLPRAFHECQPWLRTQFPQLMEDSPEMVPLLEKLAADCAAANRSKPAIEIACAGFIAQVRETFKLPAMLPVYEMGADMHTHIDPVEEAEAMVGKDRVIVVETETQENPDK